MWSIVVTLSLQKVHARVIIAWLPPSASTIIEFWCEVKSIAMYTNCTMYTRG